MARKCHHHVKKYKDYKCNITPQEELYCGICREQYCESHIFLNNRELSYYLTGKFDLNICYSCLLNLLLKEEGDSTFLRFKKKIEEVWDRIFSKNKELNQDKIFEVIGNGDFRELLKKNICVIAGNRDINTESLYNSVLYDYAPLVALSYNLRSEYNYSFTQLLNALEITIKEFRENIVDKIILLKDIDMDSYENKLSVLGESFSLFSAAITGGKAPIANALLKQLTGNGITGWIHKFGKTIWPHETARWTIIQLPLYLIDRFYENVSLEKIKI